jgi:hypothetical protein
MWTLTHHSWYNKQQQNKPKINQKQTKTKKKTKKKGQKKYFFMKEINNKYVQF